MADKQPNFSIHFGVGDITQEMPKYMGVILGNEGKIIKDLSTVTAVQVQPVNIPGFQQKTVDMMVLLTWSVVVKNEK